MSDQHRHTSSAVADRESKDISIMHLLCWIETISYGVLIGVGIWRRVLNGPNLTLTVGLIHGIIYLIYAGYAIYLWRKYDWPTVDTVWLVTAAILPGGAYYAAQRHPALSKAAR